MQGFLNPVSLPSFKISSLPVSSSSSSRCPPPLIARSPSSFSSYPSLTHTYLSIFVSPPPPLVSSSSSAAVFPFPPQNHRSIPAVWPLEEARLRLMAGGGEWGGVTGWWEGLCGFKRNRGGQDGQGASYPVVLSSGKGWLKGVDEFLSSVMKKINICRQKHKASSFLCLLFTFFSPSAKHWIWIYFIPCSYYFLFFLVTTISPLVMVVWSTLCIVK